MSSLRRSWKNITPQIILGAFNLDDMEIRSTAASISNLLPSNQSLLEAEAKGDEENGRN